jgi:hypothetical protein
MNHQKEMLKKWREGGEAKCAPGEKQHCSQDNFLSILISGETY